MPYYRYFHLVHVDVDFNFNSRIKMVVKGLKQTIVQYQYSFQLVNSNLGED